MLYCSFTYVVINMFSVLYSLKLDTYITTLTGYLSAVT